MKKFKVEIEFDKVEYDAGRDNSFLIQQWLFENYGTSIGNDAKWDSNFDYKRSAPRKLLEVYSFEHSHDAIMFALKWSP